MVKSLFISINLVGLAMLPFLFVGNVSVEHQAPSEMDAGGEVEVTITLNKGAITGPARLKLDFADAEGLEAEGIDNAGASFSFSEGSALFIWYSIQPDEQLTLTYKLKADANASGTKTISGTFSYLDEEERKKLEIPTIIVDVKGGSVASSETNGGGETTENTTTETDGNEGGATSNEASQDVVDVTCSRSIEKDGDSYLVTIDVTKGQNGGFARIKDNVPAGFSAEAVENAGAVFKFVDDAAKFLWTSLPKDEETVQVKYRLFPESAGPGMYDLIGEFSGEFMIVDDKPTSVEIPLGSFEVDGDVVINNDGGDNNNGTNDQNDGGADANNGGSDSNDGGTSTDAGTTTSIPTGNGDVMYKVQVMAAHRTVSNSYIKKHYGYGGSIDIENHEGWVKYTTGSYGVYKEARDKRNGLSSYNFPGPFVTAYKQGERISVQEALNLTNQEWIQ
ncbi:hypothetical protein [Parvicella tangerina]|uniref:Uncharacterized protein n=1 Tax=Parvicella tangerina TaxID=2829795 RepID=A0A916JPC8_9FLAO|nr:hypothetical protein [Parvicella tangerina]CAG5085295.1 hypothetical protein CRYO30217_02715 [Parvicella tangerina]